MAEKITQRKEYRGLGYAPAISVPGLVQTRPIAATRPPQTNELTKLAKSLKDFGETFANSQLRKAAREDQEAKQLATEVLSSKVAAEHYGSKSGKIEDLRHDALNLTQADLSEKLISEGLIPEEATPAFYAYLKRGSAKSIAKDYRNRLQERIEEASELDNETALGKLLTEVSGEFSKVYGDYHIWAPEEVIAQERDFIDAAARLKREKDRDRAETIAERAAEDIIEASLNDPAAFYLKYSEAMFGPDAATQGLSPMSWSSKGINPREKLGQAASVVIGKYVTDGTTQSLNRAKTLFTKLKQLNIPTSLEGSGQQVPLLSANSRQQLQKIIEGANNKRAALKAERIDLYRSHFRNYMFQAMAAAQATGQPPDIDALVEKFLDTAYPTGEKDTEGRDILEKPWEATDNAPDLAAPTLKQLAATLEGGDKVGPRRSLMLQREFQELLDDPTQENIDRATKVLEEIKLVEQSPTTLKNLRNNLRGATGFNEYSTKYRNTEAKALTQELAFFALKDMIKSRDPRTPNKFDKNKLTLNEQRTIDILEVDVSEKLQDLTLKKYTQKFENADPSTPKEQIMREAFNEAEEELREEYQAEGAAEDIFEQLRKTAEFQQAGTTDEDGEFTADRKKAGFLDLRIPQTIEKEGGFYNETLGQLGFVKDQGTSFVRAIAANAPSKGASYSDTLKAVKRDNIRDSLRKTASSLKGTFQKTQRRGHKTRNFAASALQSGTFIGAPDTRYEGGTLKVTDENRGRIEELFKLSLSQTGVTPSEVISGRLHTYKLANNGFVTGKEGTISMEAAGIDLKNKKQMQDVFNPERVLLFESESQLLNLYNKAKEGKDDTIEKLLEALGIENSKDAGSFFLAAQIRLLRQRGLVD
jgi:hypothetical protein